MSKIRKRVVRALSGTDAPVTLPSPTRVIVDRGTEIGVVAAKESETESTEEHAKLLLKLKQEIEEGAGGHTSWTTQEIREQVPEDEEIRVGMSSGEQNRGLYQGRKISVSKGGSCSL
jgi:flagellar basal body rod protein FlgF